MTQVQGIYYNGISARAHAVTLSVDVDMLVVHGQGVERRDPMGALQVMDAIGESPRVIRFVGGASCEVADRDGLAALLSGQGLAHESVAAWDRSWRIVLAGLAFVAVLGFVVYRFGLPALARTTADRLPASALDSLSSQIQRVLERTVFDETRVPGTRQVAVNAANPGGDDRASDGPHGIRKRGVDGDPHKIGDRMRRELEHQVRPVHVDRSRAALQRYSDLFAGEAVGQ